MAVFSIIIPAYNVEKYIERCLRSCLNQININSDDFEIIVVNDGSPDNSAEIAKNILAEYPNGKIIDQANKGLGGARNTGIENASGEYIWFIDSDDWIAPESLSILTKSISDYSKPDLIMFRAANVIGDIHQPRQVPEINPGIHSGVEIFSYGGLRTCAPFQIIKRDLLLKHNLRFVEGIFHEDNEFMPRLAYFSKTAVQIDAILYFVYQNPTSITRTINPKKSFDLINVCLRLSSFLSEHKYSSEATIAMNAFISLSLNTALNGVANQESHIIREFNRTLKTNKHLFNHLLASRKAKYIAEGLMFSFSSNYTRIYNLLSIFK